MYESFMYTLRSFFGSGIMRTSLFAAVILVTFICAACTSSSFRRIVQNMRDKGGWRGVIAEWGGGIFKLTVLVLIGRMLIVGLNYQAGVFQREHGRVTERNRSAILMKWGAPHEQRELSVSHTRARIRVTRQLLLKLDGKKDKIYSESFWKDAPLPLKPVNNQMPSVISSKEEKRQVSVYQKSIISADVTIEVKSNPRKLGNANYAGYDDVWSCKYIITNRSKWATTARLYFRLPAKTGFFNNMKLTLDGANALDFLDSADNGIVLKVPMEPKEKRTVVIGYSSRGLEHLRYIPARMSRSGHYRVAMKVSGVPADKLDYPIGSMPPQEKLENIKSDNYTLNWQLDDALTSYDIGIKLPDAEQPEYFFATLLSEAPIGLIMLLLVLLIPALILGTRISLPTVAVMALLFCLHFTFMGRLADLMTGFLNPYIISTVVILGIAFVFRLKHNGGELLKYQDAGIFFVMVVLFPLALISDNRDLWMQIFSIGIIAYLGILLIMKKSVGKSPTQE